MAFPLVGNRPSHTRFNPVFVVGHARSGTSLACRLLLDYLGVNFGTESQFIVRYHQRLREYGDLQDERRLRWLLEDVRQERFFVRTRRNFGFILDVDRVVDAIECRTYAGILRGIFDQFAASRGFVRWGDKTPEYSTHLPLIRELFPDAQFLHVVRDGRDVMQSVLKTGFGSKTAYEAALSWTGTLGAIERFRGSVPDSCFAQIRYEDLLRDPVATLQHVGVYLGIENSEDVVGAVGSQVRARVRAENSGKWRRSLSSRDIECFEAFAGTGLARFGYQLQFRPREGRQSRAEALYWRVQGLWRRVVNASYWRDNFYKLRLRLTDAALPLRALTRRRFPLVAGPARRPIDS